MLQAKFWSKLQEQLSLSGAKDRSSEHRSQKKPRESIGKDRKILSDDI